MNFQNPIVLAGLSAIALPIAIHLLNKFRVRHTKWAAMRFVTDSLRTQSRRIRMEDLLLLLIRCLLVMLLVLAFALPVLQVRMPGKAHQQDAIAVAIVLDNSASMGQSDGTETRFEKGKKEITKSVDDLRSDAMLSLFLVSNRPEALIAKPQADISRFRHTLQLAAPTSQSTDLARGVQAAYQSLKEITDRPRAVWLFTDNQNLGWSGLEQIKDLQRQNPGIEFKTYVLGKSGEENLAVTDIRQEGGVAAVDQAVAFRVRIANFGTKPVKSVPVRLGIDQAAPSDQALIDEIGAGDVRSVVLRSRFTTGGYHSATASIPPDRLPIDNQRSITLKVEGQSHVLIVNDTTQPVTDRSGFFLANALVPVPAERTGTYYLQTKEASFGEASQMALSGFETIFLCNPGDVSASLTAALKAYVEKGGSLVLFPGPLSRPAQWPSAFTDLLPVRLSPLPSANVVTLKNKDLVHPVSQLWSDPAQGSLNAVSFDHYFSFQPKSDSPGNGGKPAVILQTSQDEPAAVEWKYGQGRVVVFNSTATPEWNTFPVHPAFVPFLQRLMNYLTEDGLSRLNLTPGEEFVLPVPLANVRKNFQVIPPGSDNTRHPAGVIEMEGSRTLLDYRETYLPGVYRFYIEGEETPVAVCAVQMDPGESDLREAPVAEVQALQKPPETSIRPAEASMAVSHEFWTLLIEIAAVVALVELAFAHYVSRAR